MGVLRIGVVAIAIWFGACSSFGSDDASTPSPDAGAFVDGGTDATAPESGAVDADAGAFCAGAAYCDDFERADAPKGKWDALILPNGASDRVEITSDRPREAGKAIRFSIASGTQDHHAALKTTLVRNGKQKATLRFSYRPPQSFGTKGNHTDLAYLAIPNGSGGTTPIQIALLSKNTGIYLYTVDRDGEHNGNVVAHSAGEWNDVILRVDFARHTASFGIGATSEAASFDLTYDDPPPDKLEVWLGPDYGNQEGGFVLDVDAFRLDLE